jgi:hypothetical protein
VEGGSNLSSMIGAPRQDHHHDAKPVALALGIGSHSCLHSTVLPKAPSSCAVVWALKYARALHVIPGSHAYVIVSLQFYINVIIR